jgi:hypothetical protein
MTAEIRKVHYGDSRTVIQMVLRQRNTTDDGWNIVDLTGLSAGAVQFKLINAATGETALAATSTGVTFVADATGLCTYTFQSPTFAAGVYNAFFILTVGGRADHFPVEPGEFQIQVSDDEQSGRAAFSEAAQA